MNLPFNPATNKARKPVIAVAGLACETSTFGPARTTAAAFHPQRGDEIISRYQFLQPHHAIGQDAVWKGALIGHALPGGIVTREAYESLAREIVERLAHMMTTTTTAAQESLDGLWFDIHGAMCVEGLDDAEADLLRRIRRMVGADVVVSASMDLHGNVSRSLAHMCDLITCYRTAPHVDTVATQERACRNLITLLERRAQDDSVCRPLKAWVPVPILLPGEQTSTRVDPARRIYEAVPGVVEAADGAVLDAAVWVGYAWADEPRNRAAVVVTGWDAAVVARGAEKLARLFWDARAEFAFVAPTGSLDECLDAAVKSSPGRERPFFISDSGDNPTAGGSGDVTWGLARVLARPEFQRADESSSPSSSPESSFKYTVIYASLPGPKAVATAVAAGVGAEVTVTAGAEEDDLHAPPLTMTGRVLAIKHGDRDAETEVVLRVRSTCVHAILTARRKPYHYTRDFTDLGLEPRAADAIVIVKIGYLEPELYAMARRWMLALTPGAVDQDLRRLGHRRIHRPMWPFDRDGEDGFVREPDLRARLIPGSNEPLTGLDE